MTAAGGLKEDSERDLVPTIGRVRGRGSSTPKRTKGGAGVKRADQRGRAEIKVLDTPAARCPPFSFLNNCKSHPSLTVQSQNCEEPEMMGH